MSLLDYIGKYEYVHMKNIYQFSMKDNKILETQDYTEISDPTVDYTFKKIFLEGNIVKSLLNSLLFPDEKRINSINILPSEVPGEGPFSTGSIRIDILYECTLNKIIKKNKKYKTEHYTNDDCLIIDLVMERGFKNTNDERFLKYARNVGGNYPNKKIMVLALVITPKILFSKKNKGRYFQKEDYNEQYKKVTVYDDVIIYQIDLNYLLKLIKDDTEISILEDYYLKNNGKEWIKFLTVSSWCFASFKDEYYALPPLGKDFCEEKQIINAIKKLEKHDLAYMKSIIDQNSLLEEIIENKEIKDKFEEIMEENKNYKNENKKLKSENNKWKKEYEKILKEKNELMMDLDDDDDVPKKSKIKIKDDEKGKKKKLQKHYPPIKCRQKK